jgi:peptide-methionine (S)-S-oxide reductase
MRLAIISFAVSLLFAGNSCAQKKVQDKEKKMTNQATSKSGLETATFGSGCFWCTEAIFLNVDGVEKVVSGYTGGKVKNPTYKEVCSGLTGHAEVVQLTYDPNQVTYDELLEFFWKTHDPTTLNRQGNDEGTQYRSVVYYHNDEQKQLAEHYKKKLDESGAFSAPVVTEISPATTFYKAEDYHQNYYNLNSSAPYCSYVIQPKLEKFKKAFKEKLKKAS